MHGPGKLREHVRGAAVGTRAALRRILSTSHILFTSAGGGGGGDAAAMSTILSTSHYKVPAPLSAGRPARGCRSKLLGPPGRPGPAESHTRGRAYQGGRRKGCEGRMG